MQTYISLSAWGVSVRLQSKPIASISSSSRYTRAPSHVLGAPHVNCLISHCASHCAVYNTFISTCSHSCNLMLHNIALACHSLAQHVSCASCVPVHSCMSAHSSPESNCVRTARPACGDGNRTQTWIHSTRSQIQRLGRYILFVIDSHVTLLPCWLLIWHKLIFSSK